MVDMTGNNFFEEDDEFFADAFRSISELETSSSVKAIEESSSQKQNDERANDELFPSIQHYQSEKSYNEVSNPHNNNNSQKTNNGHVNNPHNERFLPGYAPKVAKRKFPGPAGILDNEPPRKLSIGNCDVSKSCEDVELELELVKSSQFSVEELLETVSWKKLQEDVSSSRSFLSNAKHFSVQRVLSDTSKKRLPKHVVVPILCLYVKKFNLEEPVSIYMDDTGEISGKVDKEVLELYRNYIRAGSSLILRKITFVCNIMLLEKSNLVSIYLNDGTVQHLQNCDALTEEVTSGLLDCIFPITPKVLERSVGLKSSETTPVLKKMHYRTAKQLLSSSSPTLLQRNVGHTNFSSPQISHFADLNVNNEESKTNDRNDDTSMSHSDLEMDDFDALLGNLDEKSFLDDF